MNENPYTSSSYSSQPLATGGAVHIEVVNTLRRTRPWMLFLAILGFIGCGFMVIGGIGMMVAGAVAGNQVTSTPFPGFFALIGVLYLAFALLYLFPCIRLAKACSAISRLNSTSSNDDLIACLEQQRRFWKFIGILTIIGISVYILVMLLALMGSFAAASRMTP